MTQNALNISKKRLSQAFYRLEKLIEQKLQDRNAHTIATISDTNRLEKLLKTSNNNYISLQTVTKEALSNCDKILNSLEYIIRK